MAEDLGESYHRHSAPIGASYHDYEEPLSSYERQCLDAENNPDEEGGEGFGWGPEYPDEVNGVSAPDEEGLYSTEPAGEGTWDSSFVNEDGLVQQHSPIDQPPKSAEADEDGQVHEHIAPEQSPQTAETGEDGQVQEHLAPEQSPQVAQADAHGNHSDTSSSPNHQNEECSVSPTRIVSLPAFNVPTNPAGEIRNLSAPMTLPTRPTPNVWPGPFRLPYYHLEPSHHTSPREPFVPSSHLSPNEQLPAYGGWEVKGPWDDGLDYSSSKGKGKAVRAYDEFRRGLRDGEKDSPDPNVADLERNDDSDTEHHSEDEGEIQDEDMPFIYIPWPSTKDDELFARREDAEVVEIRVGDDETLESILRDISLRDERRQKGKGVEDHPSTRQKDVAALWR